MLLKPLLDQLDRDPDCAFLRELPGFELADTLFTLRGIAALARCGIHGRDWKEAFS